MALDFAPLESLFDRIDALVNKDGIASKDELALVFGEHADEFLKFCDSDGDTKLTKEEFIAGIKGDTEGMSEEEFKANWVDRMEGVVKQAEDKAAAEGSGFPGDRAALYNAMLDRVKHFDGFLAALDQSGGSTPKALLAYGVEAAEYNGEAEMYDKIHEMRTRIVSSPGFSGEDVLGAILFEMTMDRQFHGVSVSEYLWRTKNVVPFVKCDKGLADEENDCQLMKPMPDLDTLLDRAVAKGVFGTKMRSLIKRANPEGIKAIVAQQFEVGKQILAKGLMPIIEPEIDIKSDSKDEAEALMKAAILEELDSLPEGQLVMLKLTPPNVDNLYKELVDHPKIAKVVALSGGYSQSEANERLAKQNGMVASFSRALVEGLSSKQSDEDFDAMLTASIKAIHAASSS